VLALLGAVCLAKAKNPRAQARGFFALAELALLKNACLIRTGLIIYCIERRGKSCQLLCNAFLA
jgi:hypothetical protein